MRSCIKKIEGLDYCNCLTCFGGKNVVKVFGNKPRSFTVTMCSVRDFPVIGALETPDSSQLRITLTHHALFWNHINAAMALDKRKAKNFIVALEYMYGNQVLQGHVADIDKDFFTHETILNEACRTADTEVVKAILHMGAKLWARGRCDPLHTAIEFGREEIVELLCSQKASVQGCLDACIKFKQKACVNVILKYCEEQYLLEAVGTAIETHQPDIASQITKERMKRDFRREEKRRKMEEEMRKMEEEMEAERQKRSVPNSHL